MATDPVLREAIRERLPRARRSAFRRAPLAARRSLFRSEPEHQAHHRRFPGLAGDARCHGDQGRRHHGLCDARRRRRLSACRAAGHGRLESRSRGPADHVRRPRRLPRPARLRLDRPRRRCAPSKRAVDLATTLFIVASKSGGTTETASFHAYFYERLRQPRRRRGRDATSSPSPTPSTVLHQRSPGAAFPARLPQPARHRRALLGAVATSAWCPRR